MTKSCVRNPLASRVLSKRGKTISCIEVNSGEVSVEIKHFRTDKDLLSVYFCKAMNYDCWYKDDRCVYFCVAVVHTGISRSGS